jgi:hypothetical protein
MLGARKFKSNPPVVDVPQSTPSRSPGPTYIRILLQTFWWLGRTFIVLLNLRESPQSLPTIPMGLKDRN